MELIYITDPMCSWCWGFAPAIERIQESLPAGMDLALVLGGLAPDSDDPMPAETRAMVQGAWDAVEQRTGARFNRDFWERCAPRRSTWPACRAVLAARRLETGADWRVFKALQRAYYLEARNPSDEDTLIAVAGEQGLDKDAFRILLTSAEVQEDFAKDRQRCAEIGPTAFPTLAVSEPGGLTVITRGWQPFEAIEGTLAEHGIG